MVVGEVLLKQVGFFIRFPKLLESIKSFGWWSSGVLLKPPISSTLSYFSLYKVSALVTSEITISDLKDGVSC